MSAIPDSKFLYEISVPGTHDTMARAGVLWAWCQSLSLNTQLEIGIRFFDIRCRHFKNGLPIHHGIVYENCNFTDCMNTMASFVRSNPSECVLVRVTDEYEEAECTRTFCQTVWEDLQNYRDILWLEEKISPIKDVRGKIVILRDFKKEDKPIGIDYTSLDIEDDWSVSNLDHKWGKVKAHLDKARTQVDTKMLLTFNSCTKGGDAPREIARTLNPKLHSYVRNYGGRLGIIAIDYPGPKLIENIIDNNF